ncbi:MAG: regulatory domain of in-like proprotein convertase, partial [Verrucomicrobiales bacterium]|nr:regulatory domain of in-like proprotein convertase [Verrucomicrobiales bacterium]
MAQADSYALQDLKIYITFQCVLEKVSSALRILLAALVFAVSGFAMHAQTPAFDRLSLPADMIGDAHGNAVWGDYDNDGNLDLLFARHLTASDSDFSTNRVQLWRNDGNGVFVRVPLPTLPNSFAFQNSLQVEWLDLNNDGRLDIVLKGNENVAGLQFFLNQGNGLFVLTNAPAFTTKYSSAAWGDYDNDGKVDVIVATTTTPVTYQLWHNDGNGQFSQAPFPAPTKAWTAPGLVSFNWTDYDHDGNLDLLITGRTNANTFGQGSSELWRNQGGGQFVYAGNLGPAVFNASVAWADLNNDGYLDMVVTGADTDTTTPTTQIDINSALFWDPVSSGFSGGLGQFPDPSIHHERPFPGVPAYNATSLGDYDNDGRVDIIMGGFTGVGFQPALKLYRNDSQGPSFGQNYLFTTDVTAALLPGVFGISQGSVAWGDFNNDGRLDLVVQGDDGNVNPKLQVWVNRTAVANTPPTAPSGLVAITSGSTATLIWQPASDAQTPAPGLSYNIRVGTTAGGGEIVSPMSGPDGHRRLPALGNARDRQFALVNNLTPGQTYYWTVQAIDGGWMGGPFAAVLSFVAGQSQPPATFPGASLQISARAATVRETVSPAGAATAAWVEFGVTTSYGSTTVTQALGSGLLAASFTNTLSVLSPATTYHYRVVARNANGLSFGADQTLATAALAGTLPVTQAPISVRTVFAIVQGTVIPGGLDTQTWIEYGLTTSYGSTSAVRTVGSGFSSVTTDHTLSGLRPGTFYHYRVAVTNEAGLAYGGDQSFTTLQDFSILDLTLPGDPIAANPNGIVDSAFPVQWATDNTARSKFSETFSAGYTISPSGTNLLRALTLISADNPNSDPSRILLEGSADGVNFTTLTNLAVPGFPAPHSLQTFKIDSSVAYQTYRLSITAVQNTSFGFGQISEVELLSYGLISSPSDAAVLSVTPGTSIIRSASKLFDGLLDGGNDKLELQNMNGPATLYLTPAAGSSVLKGFELIGALDDATYPGRVPSLVIVAGSNDGAVYTTLGAGTPLLPTADMQIQEFSLTGNTASYSSYRITFIGPISGTTLQIGELRLLGLTGSSPAASTQASDRVNARSAHLNGTATPNGQTALVSFQWGPTTAYGNTTPVQNLGDGTSSVAVSATLLGLAPGSTYHYRVVVTTSLGAAAGSDKSFITLADGTILKPLSFLSPYIPSSPNSPAGQTASFAYDHTAATKYL